MEDPKAGGGAVLMFIQAVAATAWHVHEVNTPDQYLERFNGYLDVLIGEEVPDGVNREGVEFLRETFVTAVGRFDAGANGLLN